MTTVERTVSFSASEVASWCDQAGDSNQIHLSEEAGRNSVFGERVVPGVMILDQVSGLLWQYGEAEGQTTILANLVACRFRNPVPLDTDVTISVEDTSSDEKFTYLDFEARVDGELAAHGTASIVLK